MGADRAKILIVEDDANLSRATALRLQAAGFEAIAARDAYQALKFARRGEAGPGHHGRPDASRGRIPRA